MVIDLIHSEFILPKKFLLFLVTRIPITKNNKNFLI